MAEQRSDEEARRAYWAEQMELGLRFVAQATEYPVAECGEAMVALPTVAREAGVEVAFSTSRLGGRYKRVFCLREGLAPEFAALAREMNRKGWILKVEDAFRTVPMQKRLGRFPRVFDQVVERTRWELGGEAPGRDLLMRRLSVLVAACPKVGTHMSGSAMDISVLRRGSDEEIDRGGPYLEMSERTPMGSPFVSRAARRNREAITALMAHHGFVAYPFEFWHYSRGDAYDEILSRTGRPARYGAVSMDSATRQTAPLADPLAPLNSPEEIQRELRRAIRRA